MRIAGLQKLTLLDFPSTRRPPCSFRAATSAALLPQRRARAGPERCNRRYTGRGVFAFLDKRHGLLDGVCITGGDPLLQPDLADFCARIKRAGFAVKLDTNGSFPDRLRELVESGSWTSWPWTRRMRPVATRKPSACPAFDVAPVAASIDYLRSTPCPTSSAPPSCASFTSPPISSRSPAGSPAPAPGTCRVLPMPTPYLPAPALCMPGSRRPRGPPSRTAQSHPQHPAARRVEERTRRVLPFFGTIGTPLRIVCREVNACTFRLGAKRAVPMRPTTLARFVRTRS